MLSEERTAAREASGVAVHPSGILLVVDDEAGIFAHARSKGRMEVPIAEICGCEGVALDEAGTTLYVVSEDSRKVTAFAVRAKGGSITLGEPEKRGALPELGSKSNKGWEGLAVRPGVDVARLSLHAAAGPSATRSPSAPPHEVAGGASYLVASWQVRSSDAWHGDRGGRRRCRLRILGEEA